MGRLKIENETLYVIYRNGAPYNGDGTDWAMKAAYNLEANAKGMLTKLIHKLAVESVESSELLTEGVYMAACKELAAEFEIVEYGPKRSRPDVKTRRAHDEKLGKIFSQLEGRG